MQHPGLRYLPLVVAAVLLPRAAAGATISVNTTADTSTNPSFCTLRDAITAANTNTATGGCAAGEPGRDTIDFQLRLQCLFSPCVIELATALPTVTEDLTLDGGSALPTIRRFAVPKFPVLDLGPISAEIRNVTLRDGDIQGGGGAIRLNATTLTVRNVTFATNSASGNGGAISVFIGSSLAVESSTFGGNRAQDGGAIGCLGGSVTVVKSRFAGNQAAGDGGAIFADVGTMAPDGCPLTVVGSTFDGNTAGATGFGAGIPPATGSGGAIFVRRPLATIMDSTFIDNEALRNGSGGAIALRAWTATDIGTATVANVTVSGNRARQHGGGIIVDGGINLYNVTVTGNTADEDASGSGDGGGVFHAGGAFEALDIKVQSSIIAGNFDSSGQAGFPSHPDVSGTFASQGYNVIGTGDGSTGFGATTSDQVGGGTQIIEALLGPLADNGGLTMTHAPLPGSPAIDRGNPQPPKRDSACMEMDQRGVVRPLDGDGDGTPVCDAGAHEVDAVAPPASTTTTATITATSTTTSTSTAGILPPTTTSTTIPGGVPACDLAQLPDDAPAGVHCAVAAARSTLADLPETSCACKRCVVAPRLDRAERLLGQAESASSARKCRRKLNKARRAARAFGTRAAKLAKRECLAPSDRAAALAGDAAEVARRTAALAESAFCAAR